MRWAARGMSDPKRPHRLRRAQLTGAARDAVPFVVPAAPLAGHTPVPYLQVRARS
jgi:hypothetical protein